MTENTNFLAILHIKKQCFFNDILLIVNNKNQVDLIFQEELLKSIGIYWAAIRRFAAIPRPLAKRPAGRTAADGSRIDVRPAGRASWLRDIRSPPAAKSNLPKKDHKIKKPYQQLRLFY